MEALQIEPVPVPSAPPVAVAPPQSEPRGELARELQKMEWEPLLPVEKKLIAWSIGLGVGLLGILVWVSYTFFPAGH
ncbi:MAG: hypothetical protein ACM3PC_14780 [Deltaproteobacteria bacterium]